MPRINQLPPEDSATRTDLVPLFDTESGTTKRVTLDHVLELIELSAGSNVTITGTGTPSDPFVINAASSGTSDWGDLGGTLSDQTDLQTALDAKLNKTGDTMTGNLTFDTDDGIRLTSGTATSTATGLIQLKSDDEDSKAIIEFYDKDDNVTHWIQAHDYLKYYEVATATSVFTGANTLVATGNNFDNGVRVQLSTSGTLPTPLATSTNYFVYKATANNISLHTTYADSLTGTNPIDITTTGTGTVTITPDNEYNGNRHHHLSIEASDDDGLLQTRLGIGYGSDNVEVAVNQADLVIRRNSGMTNGNILMTGGGGGGNIKHDNNLDIYPQILTSGTKAFRFGVVSNVPTLTALDSDNISIDDGLIINESGTAKNFRVEGSGFANLLMTDGTNDRVGMGTGSPSERLSVNGNISVTGTVDGRDISADGSKLDGIEALAEVNNISDANATDLTDGGTTTLHSHVVTKSDVGLPNVDNTSDATKNAAAVTLTNKTLTSPVINAPTGFLTGAAKITVGTSTPGSPTTGDLWIDTN